MKVCTKCKIEKENCEFNNGRGSCKLCHYTNLQPLWAEDNIKKSNKILINK